MTPRIRSLAAAEPLVPPQFRAAPAPQIARQQVFREFVETLQRLHDGPRQAVRPKKNGTSRAKAKPRGARKTSK